MRNWLFLLVMAATATGTPFGTHGRAVRAQSAERMATAEIEAFVKQAVTDRLVEGNLPDGGLLGRSTRIAVREELPGAGVKLGPGALPQRDGYEFYLISTVAAQVEADKTGKPVHFIAVDRPVFVEDTGTVSLGVDVVFPREPDVIKMCCCSGHGLFRRANGRWTFVKWADISCS
jgi:hypothetical protein